MHLYILGIQPMSQHTIELSIVMAGAVSAGSYTAGVMTRIFELFDDYHDYFDSIGEEPPVLFNLRTIGGTSAGGVNAAVAAVCAKRNILSSNDAPYHATEDNPFYDAWVTGIKVDRILHDKAEVELKEVGLSIVNSIHLNEVGRNILSKKIEGVSKTRTWINDGTRYLFTVSNLPGVGYTIDLPPNSHGMINHRDWISFGRDPTISNAFSLDSKLDWDRLSDAALATSAFPFGTSARQVELDTIGVDHYSDPLLHSSPHKPTPIPNSAPKTVESPYCIDGGVINNEPVYLINKYLINDTNHHKNTDDITLMSLMVDPFPDNLNDHKFIDGRKLKNVLCGLISAWKNTARFKPEAINYNGTFEIKGRSKSKRGLLFSINPSRKKQQLGGGQANLTLASGGWGGFFGFFSAKFRDHDFKLGYKNADSMLLKHLKVNLNGSSASLIEALKILHDRSGVDEQATIRRQGSLNQYEMHILPIALADTKLWRHVEQPEWPIQKPYINPKRVRIDRDSRSIHLNRIVFERNEDTAELQRVEIKLIKRLKWFQHQLLKNEFNMGWMTRTVIKTYVNNKVIPDVKERYRLMINDMYKDR